MTNNTRHILGIICFIIMAVFIAAAILIPAFLYNPKADSGKSAIEGKVVVAEGVFALVTYYMHSREKTTIIHFADGRTFVFDGILEISQPIRDKKIELWAVESESYDNEKGESYRYKHHPYIKALE